MYRIQFLLLTLFCLTASADHHGDGPPNPCHIYYPNIPGELLLENDKLIVQRFIIAPGQWEGIHRHPPDQLYIHVKGANGRSNTVMTRRRATHLMAKSAGVIRQQN